jgi:hypothetical protein
MDLSPLATLKERLVTAEKFSDVMDYFFDHFGENPAFIALGERIEEPFLESVLLQIGGQIFPGKVTVGHLILTRLPEHQFIHGGFTVNGHLANLLYFEDIQVGLMAVVMPPPSMETKLVRFTGRRLPRSRGPSVN